jgi:ankyrin repeat protein
MIVANHYQGRHPLHYPQHQQQPFTAMNVSARVSHDKNDNDEVDDDNSDDMSYIEEEIVEEEEEEDDDDDDDVEVEYVIDPITETNNIPPTVPGGGQHQLGKTATTAIAATEATAASAIVGTTKTQYHIDDDTHFDGQQEHFFDNYDVLGEYYEEETLVSLYEVENDDYPEEYIDMKRKSDTVMKQLSLKNKERNNNNNKSSTSALLPQHSCLSKPKRNYVMKKYKARQDPYIDELRERLSRRYRWEVVTESDGTSTKIGTVPWKRQDEEEEQEDDSSSCNVNHKNKNTKAMDATATTVAGTMSDGSLTTTGSKSSLVSPSTDSQLHQEGNENQQQNRRKMVHESHTTHDYTVDDDGYIYEEVEVDDSVTEQSCHNVFLGRPNPIPSAATAQSVRTEDDFTFQTYHSYDEVTVGYEEKPKSFSNIEIFVVSTAGNDLKEDGYNKFIDGDHADHDDETSPHNKVISKNNDRSKSNTSVGSRTSAQSLPPPTVESLIFDTLAHQQQEQAYPGCVTDGDDEPPAMMDEQSSFQLKYKTDKRSVLHDYLKERDWKGMTQCLEMLKEQNKYVIRQELTRVNSKRQSTPLHVAVAKAPRQLTTFLISLIPFEYRDEILTSIDSEGNTPLHIACETLEVGLNTSYTSIVKVLMLGASRVHRIQNYNGDTPLSLLLASPAMRARRTLSVSDFVEAVAEELVESILKDHATLLHERNDNGRTPLHMAAANCAHDRILKVLLDTGEGVSVAQLTDQHGMLPLHYLSSCTSGRIPSIKSAKRLLDAYPQGISHQTSTGDTPLHLLISNISSWIKDETDLNDTNTEYLVQILAGGPDIRKSKSPLLMRNNDTVRH